MRKLLPERWSDPAAYGAGWSERNERLLALAEGALPEPAGLDFSEYGCGPHAPFAAAVARVDESAGRRPRKVHRFDRKRWDEGCGLIDFNEGRLDEAVPSAVGVFSGVLEYLDDADAALAFAARHHRWLLASYAPVTTPPHRLKPYAAEIDRRAFHHGWRNHLSADAFVALISRHGFIIRTGLWKEQMLVLAQLAAR